MNCSEKKIITYFIVAFLGFCMVACIKPTKQENNILLPVKPVYDSVLKVHDDALNVILVSDWGRNGFYNQREVAEKMAEVASSAGTEFFISCGDNFQVNGVQSVNDPLWRINFEDIYVHPSLQKDWYPVLGNHDYHGNTQALIDYSHVSRRWKMPARFYTKTKKLTITTPILFIFLDTPPLINSYYEEPEEYPDVETQDSLKQMKWLKTVLNSSTEQWKIAIGHHPVYSASTKHGNTHELIAKFSPLFEKYKVDAYFSGHDHDFQHLKPKGSYTDYFVTGTGSAVRESSTDENSVFSMSAPGFTYLSVSGNELKINFIDKEGNIVYTYTKAK
ncbi:MAG: acid phosphatase [Bacteroidales bacterium]|nr:acid phosphatase [Bacteroidales bacterium]